MTRFYEELTKRINEAYGKTTPANNLFKKVVESIKWEDTYEADGETYYLLGEFTLMIENIDPFKEAWKPSIIFGTFFKELGWM